MATHFPSSCIRTSLDDDSGALLSGHYLNEVLPNTKEFKAFHTNRLLALVNSPARPLAQIFDESREPNERQIEDALIRPILEALGSTLRPAVPINTDFIDFCIFTPNPAFTPDGFDQNFTNTTGIVESKRYGRIENKYFIRKEDNTDEIFKP